MTDTFVEMVESLRAEWCRRIRVMEPDPLVELGIKFDMRMKCWIGRSGEAMSPTMICTITDSSRVRLNNWMTVALEQHSREQS